MKNLKLQAKILKKFAVITKVELLLNIQYQLFSNDFLLQAQNT